jgi:threonine dehydratase
MNAPLAPEQPAQWAASPPAASLPPLSLADLHSAAATVYAAMPPTPQYRWSLLEAGWPSGSSLWVKHENYSPLGAFKVRGGLVYVQGLLASGQRPAELVSATRGNHGQSIAFAARRHGLKATLFVPRGNSLEKNAAMRALGAQVVETGHDFQASREAAAAYAAQSGAHMVPSFHPDLVAGVASYALELFSAAPGLHTVYVPIGLGSGACGLIAARDALGLPTRIVGVVNQGAPAYALSLAQGRLVEAPVSTTLADGMACRLPDPQALAMLAQGLERTVLVTDAQIAQAMRQLFEATHNVAEGAGAAALADAWAERERLGGQACAVVLSGGNIDRPLFAQVLQDAA